MEASLKYICSYLIILEIQHIQDCWHYRTSKDGTVFECVCFVLNLVRSKKISLSEGMHGKSNLKLWILDISWKSESSKKNL